MASGRGSLPHTRRRDDPHPCASQLAQRSVDLKVARLQPDEHAIRIIRLRDGNQPPMILPAIPREDVLLTRCVVLVQPRMPQVPLRRQRRRARDARFGKRHDPRIVVDARPLDGDIDD